MNNKAVNNEAMLREFLVARGNNEILVTPDGREYLDLMTGFGAVLLGHGHRSIVDQVHRQLEDVWLTGRVNMPIVQEAANLVVSNLSGPYRLEQFYSSGNEAVEFVVRVATSATGRKALVGFDRSMHGKSITASALCWQNAFVDLKGIHSLPFIHTSTEEEILERLEQTLRQGDVAAVFSELIQGTNGAREASAGFYRTVGSLCREYGSLWVVDEVLTGFYRSGSVSYAQKLGLTPDILIFGKAMGNGFPISAVVCREEIEMSGAMHPGSTFSGNPLAASAVSATLSEMNRLDMPTLVGDIDRTIRSELAELRDKGLSLRGHGAMFVLEFPDNASAMDVQARAFRSNLLVSANEKFVRLFPPATISKENLLKSLDIIRSASLSG